MELSLSVPTARSRIHIRGSKASRRATGRANCASGREAVTKARDALRQKKLYKDASGSTPSAAEEEKVLARCLAAVAEAEYKIEAVRKWLPKLEKANDVYRGGVAGLNRAVTGEIPTAVALLDRLAGTLEEYVQIETPAGSTPESAAPSLIEESMSRGGDAAPETPAKTGASAAGKAAGGPSVAKPASQPETPTRKEGRDVADGQ